MGRIFWNRRFKTHGGLDVDGGCRVDCGLKSQFENAWEDWIGRGGWREEGRLKSQIENTWEERIGRGRLRKEGGLKLHFINARDDRMGREIEIAD